MKLTIHEATQQQSITFQFRCWPWMRDAIRRKAEKAGMSDSEWVREQIMKAVER